MTKDGIREKVSRDLHRLYDDITEESIPDELMRLIDRLTARGEPPCQMTIQESSSSTSRPSRH
jgi:hypothetical protein